MGMENRTSCRLLGTSSYAAAPVYPNLRAAMLYHCGTWFEDTTSSSRKSLLLIYYGVECFVQGDASVRIAGA
jgi:hypothetical protein